MLVLKTPDESHEPFFSFRCANVAVSFTFKEFHGKKKKFSQVYLNRLNSMLVPKVNKSGLLKGFLRVVLVSWIRSNERDASFSSSRLFALMAEKEAKVQVC